MATSPNYAWAEPDNSSLVKNGAADIRTLGDAIDTSVWNVGFGQAGKNKIINGNFSIWQRGTSFSTNNAYTADRWYVTGDGTPTFTLSQQSFTPASAPVAGYEGQYFARYAVTSAGGSTYRQFQQLIEDVRTFAGQSVTISFWARINSGTVSGNYVRLNQVFGSGGSATVNGSNNTFTLTSSWQRFTLSTSVASISGKTIGTSSYLALDFVMPFTTTMSVDFWGVQVEYGSKATPFQTASGGSPQAELSMAQRYYWRNTPSVTYGVYGIGFIASTTSVKVQIANPTPMRVTPTVLDYANLQYLDFANSRGTLSAPGISAVESTTQISTINFTTSGATAARGCFINNDNNTAGYLGLGAEL